MSVATVSRPLTLAERIAGRSTFAAVASVVGGAAFTALLAQVSITLPFTPVPITLQTLAVLAVGGVLGSRLGAASMALYVLVGAVGLPVFAGGTAGGHFLLGPTGGYLVGFILASAVVGKLAERGWDRDRKALLAMVLGEVALYAVALPWLGFDVGFGRVIALGFLPFALGDALKLLAASGLLPLGWRIAGAPRR